jgi:hypothetical protein
MSLSEREAKRAHVRQLRDRALALIRARGNAEGNIDYNGQTTHDSVAFVLPFTGFAWLAMQMFYKVRNERRLHIKINR